MNNLNNPLERQYYVDIVMNKPNFIKVQNSFERFCLYTALEQYARDFNTVWFNKSYKKEPVYADTDLCKYCFRKNRSCKIEEWEKDDWESYFGGEFHYHCKTCNNFYADVWVKGDFMFIKKTPCKINIYYEQPSMKLKCFQHL